MSPSSLEFGSATPGTLAHRLEHLCRRELEARLLRALHVDPDRLAEAAEDRALPVIVGAHAGDLAQLAAQLVWISYWSRLRSAFGLSCTKMQPLFGVPRKPPPTRHVGERDLRLALEEGRDLAPLRQRVLEARAGRHAEVDVELAAVDVGQPGEAELRQDQRATRRSSRPRHREHGPRRCKRHVEPARDSCRPCARTSR